MSGDGRSRKRNLLSGGPKTGPSKAKATPSSNTSSLDVNASTPVIVADSLKSSAAVSQGRQTRQSTSSQRTLEPFAFTQTRSAARKTHVIPEVIEDDDDDIQIIEEPKPKRSNRRKSNDEVKKEAYVIPDSLSVLPENKNSERQGTPFTSIQSRKGRKSIPTEVIPDSIAEVEEIDDENPSKSSKKNKRNPKQAGLEEGLGEAVKAVKKIKLSTPTPSNDLKNVSLQSTIRSAPPGKMFQKARQGSFYVALPTQRISVNEMSVWSGNE